MSSRGDKKRRNQGRPSKAAEVNMEQRRMKEMLKRRSEREVKLTEEPKQKPGRNELCYCGSGQKYKKCCLLKEQEKCTSLPTPALHISTIEQPQLLSSHNME
jgi:hypothetical protein